MLTTKQQDELAYMLNQNMLNLSVDYWLDHQDSIYAEKLFWQAVIDGSEVLRDKARYKVNTDKIDRDSYYFKQDQTIKPLSKKLLTELLKELSTINDKDYLSKIKLIELQEETKMKKYQSILDEDKQVSLWTNVKMAVAPIVLLAIPVVAVFIG